MIVYGAAAARIATLSATSKRTSARSLGNITQHRACPRNNERHVRATIVTIIISDFNNKERSL